MHKLLHENMNLHHHLSTRVVIHINITTYRHLSSVHNLRVVGRNYPCRCCYGSSVAADGCFLDLHSGKEGRKIQRETHTTKHVCVDVT